MRKRGIRNIIFDLGGVLINLDRTRCVENFKKLGIDNAEELIGLYGQKAFFGQLESGQISPETFREEVRKHAGKPLTDEEIDKAFISILLDIPAYKLDALLRLRERYLVYLLSNTNDIHWKWMCENSFRYRTFEADDFFEELFLSHQMKLTKPDPKIFTEVVERTGIVPKETLFIDDSQANCDSAAALGFNTYVCKPGEDWTTLFFGK